MPNKKFNYTLKEEFLKCILKLLSQGFEIIFNY